jgi:hypothetical protein
MRPLKKPSVKTPYETICELNPSWKSEMEEAVKNRIKDIEAAIKKEAEKSGDDRMADEEFLYTRFKDNVSTGMIFANWEVLKYFSKILLCKWYYEHIGEWKYTEEDVEMYRYFRDVEVTQKTKCRKKFIKFNSVDEEVFAHSEELDQVTEKSLLYYELDDGRADNVITVNYFDLYYGRWLLINDIETNCLMHGKYARDDLFDSENLFRSATLEYANAYGHISNISDTPMFTNYARELKDMSEKPFETLCRKIDESLKSNEEYKRTVQKLSKIMTPVIMEVLELNKFLVDRLHPSEVLALKKLINIHQWEK